MKKSSLFWALGALAVAILTILLPILAGCSDRNEEGEVVKTRDAASPVTSIKEGTYELEWFQELSSEECEQKPTLPDRLKLPPVTEPSAYYWLEKGCKKPWVNFSQAFYFSDTDQLLVLHTLIYYCNGSATFLRSHYIHSEENGKIVSAVIARPADGPCLRAYRMEGTLMPY